MVEKGLVKSDKVNNHGMLSTESMEPLLLREVLIDVKLILGMSLNKPHYSFSRDSHHFITAKHIIYQGGVTQLSKRVIGLNL